MFIKYEAMEMLMQQLEKDDFLREQQKTQIHRQKSLFPTHETLEKLKPEKMIRRHTPPKGCKPQQHTANPANSIHFPTKGISNHSEWHDRRKGCSHSTSSDAAKSPVQNMSWDPRGQWLTMWKHDYKNNCWVRAWPTWTMIAVNHYSQAHGLSIAFWKRLYCFIWIPWQKDFFLSEGKFWSLKPEASL